MMWMPEGQQWLQCAGELSEDEQTRQNEQLREWVRPRRAAMREAIRAERARGVQWLAAVVLFVVWVSEIFDNDTPLRP